MRLKQLDIKGFKSFADKTQVLFDNQITGVVGPNGCGKSNIVDAIRWVIGEHKISALRSDNLDGLVFNGSRTRPASAMAEVSLTFDNDRNVLPTDYSTVTVSRKFYKNGDSEYRLNDVVCRLKDINNLFMDTGVSSDSYAIIELGMVDDIIKDKDNARRRMLEQAAGISIYKTRKKEAQQKLKATEIDLNRIEDLLHEIKGNLKTLDNQAKKAERYKALKSEYKDVSVKFAQKSLSNFNKEFQQLNKKIIDYSQEKITLEKTVNDQEESIQSLKEDVNSREQILNGLREEYQNILQIITRLEQEKQLNLQKLFFQKDKVSNLQTFIHQAELQIKDLKEAIVQIEQDEQAETLALSNTEQDSVALQTALEESEAAFRLAKSVLEEKKNALNDKQNQKFRYEKDFAVIESTISNVRKSIALEKEESEKRKQLKNQWLEDEQVRRQRLEESRSRFSGLIAEQEQLKSTILQQQEELENIRSQWSEANRNLDAKRNEYQLLKSLVDSLEGYPDSIKYLSKNDDWKDHGVLLSDIILPQSDYKAAIENILSPYLNYFVVKNLDDAQSAIRLLQTNKKGKASFFILNQINAEEPAAPLDGMVCAKDVVEYDSIYAPLVTKLLSHVYIHESENDIMPISQPYTIIDKEGKTLQNQYAIIGGSAGMFDGNKIGRGKNLEKLADAMHELETIAAEYKIQFENTQNSIRQTQEGLSEQRIDELRHQIQQEEQELYGIEQRLDNLEKSELQSQEKQEQWDIQLQEQEQKIAEIKTQNQDMIALLDSIHESIKQADESYISSEEVYRLNANRWNVYNVELEAKKTKLKGMQENLDLRRKQLQDLQHQLEINTKSLQETNQIIQESEGLETGFIAQIEEQLVIRSGKQDYLNKLDQEYHIQKKQLQDIESEINKIRKHKDVNDTELLESKEKMNAMKLQVSTLNERMKLEFDVNLDSILNEEVHLEESQEELEQEAALLKQKILGLGEVNPTAIEAFQEMNDRFEFIKVQRDDLLSAKDNLLQTITEVETTANQKFLDTFNQVRENFKMVFQSLFTSEDTCDITMTDPTNPSETGIEIFARPKGKKPSVITQLSGGEKTLTSTALLFAIYLIKPAPFCILDEVDAPLDDANVEKFTQMIRKFSDNSQFIIVTHNKQTMAAVDAIYGVTMQEPGVSKLVPVDFRSLN